MYLVALVLFILGAAVGSLANAVAWRLHESKNWLTGRSQCPNCGHKLAAIDLIPIFSWLILRGRCRYCHRRIAKLYPAVELAGGAVFSLSYIYWPTNLNAPGAKFELASWLLVVVGLLVLALYDLRYQILPTRVIYPTLVIAAAGRLVYILAYSPHKIDALGQWLAALAIASGLFWLLYQLSAGRWVGFGDVRLGLVTGTVLATPGRAILMIFAGSLLGSAAAMPGLLNHRLKPTSLVAYGPYLITGTWLSLLFGDSLIDWYKHFLK